jgi:DNA-binding MarR family transcriptional regulator
MPNEIFLTMSVSMLNAALEARVQEFEAQVSLSRHDIKVLMHLTEPKRMGALADDLQVLPSTLTAVADRLEGHGLLQRKRDPHDRRAWLLEITEAGHALQAEAHAMATNGFRTLTGLNADEIQTFVNLMQKVLNTMTAESCIGEVNP